MRILIKLIITAVAVWVATLVLRHHGVSLGGHGLHKILTLVAVAIIFGLINAVLKPIIKAIGCWAYALTFGLIAIVVNGFLFWLTGWLSGKLHLHFHVSGIVAAILGGLIVGVVSWILTLIVDRD